MPSDMDFRVGDRVASNTYEQRGEILAKLRRIGGEQYYKVQLTSGKSVSLGARDLAPVRDSLERLACWDFGYATEFDLLTQATALSFAYRYEGLSCLSNSRLEPKPYQVFVAHRVLQDLHPRYLLADEVGLGKTIEAGMILKELRARELVERVLIVVPASLREQWKGELDIKFNEQFHIYTGATLKENLRRFPDRNPWTLDDSIIVSLPFARLQTSQELESRKGKEPNWGIEEADWDLVIFDEAHHLRRYLQGQTIDSKRRITKSYRLADSLADNGHSLLLLTAVPLQLSRYETFSLVELLDPTLFPTFEDFQSSMSRTEVLAPAGRALRELEVEGKIDDDALSEAVFFMFYGLDGSQEFGGAAPFWDGLRECCSQVGSRDEQRAATAAAEGMIETFASAIDAFERFGYRNQEDERTIRKITRTIESFKSFISSHPEVFRQWVEEQHALSQIMIRNRKREVLKGEMVDRRAYTVPVDLTPTEEALHEEVSDYIRTAYGRAIGNQALGLVLTTFRKLLVSSPHALAASLERRATRIEEALETLGSVSSDMSEDELEELAEILESAEQLDDLLGLTGGLSPEQAQDEIDTLRDLSCRARAVADPHDSKAQELIGVVETIHEAESTAKILIFTQFLETQAYLRRLLEKRGYRVAIFRGEGGSSSYSKKEQFRRFKRDPNIRIMVSTRVGGEGLNFQFCNAMINYDLPWNPMRIEQRIGRLDRIGQERDVQIYNFLLEGTLDARILTVLQERIQLFERTIGNLDPILGEKIQKDIKEIVLADRPRAERKLANWEERIEQRVKEAREAEEKMADFILDARSFRRDTVDGLLGRELPLSNKDIESFALDFLRRYPTDTVKYHGDQLYTIDVPRAFGRACDRLYESQLHERYEGTFDPRTAIENDTVDFFAFGHPLVDAMIRYCRDDELNNCFDAGSALRILHDDEHSGYEGVQFNYIVRFEGVRTYKKLIPVVLDLQGCYDEAMSQLVFSLRSENRGSQGARIHLSESDLRQLEARSEEVIDQIAEEELEEARRRNAANYKDQRQKKRRLFHYRVAREEMVLDRREARLRDARRKGQEQILPALKGQVDATKRRIQELEEQVGRDLVELGKKRNTSMSMELLNVAYVKIH